jgi:hypothetical protein
MGGGSSKKDPVILEGEFVVQAIRESTAPPLAIINMVGSLKKHPDYPAIDEVFVREVINKSSTTKLTTKIHLMIRLNILESRHIQR